jgi:AcrR family transcriptional regulator
MVEKEEIRDQIVEVSRQIFGRMGFKGTTMDEIAHGINKGKSSIYYYFPGKEDIYQAVIEKEVSLLHAEIQRSISQVESPVEKLKVYVLVRLRTLSTMTNFYEALKNEYFYQFDFVSKIREINDKEESAMVENLLKDGVARNIFVIHNTELASIAIVTAMRGLEAPLLQCSEIHLEERIDHLLAILFYGIIRR